MQNTSHLDLASPVSVVEWYQADMSQDCQYCSIRVINIMFYIYHPPEVLVAAMNDVPEPLLCGYQKEFNIDMHCNQLLIVMMMIILILTIDDCLSLNRFCHHSSPGLNNGLIINLKPCHLLSLMTGGCNVNNNNKYYLIRSTVRNMLSVWCGVILKHWDLTNYHVQSQREGDQLMDHSRSHTTLNTPRTQTLSVRHNPSPSSKSESKF